MSFSEGMSRVSTAGKHGYIDKLGVEIIPLIYDEAYNFSDGMARVSIFGKTGFINKKGKEVFVETKPFSKGELTKLDK